MPTPFTWIYLIHDLFTDWHKIGQSDDPKARLRELTRKPSTILPIPNDFVLKEAWFCPASKEAEFHKQFSHLRKRGEWFALSEDEIDVIESDLYKHERLISSDSKYVEELAVFTAEVMNSHMFYARGVEAFLRAGIRQTGDPFMFAKQLTTSLPSQKWYHE